MRSYIIDRSTVDHFTKCWNWDLSVNTGGYGNGCWDGKPGTAHRIAYRAFNGPIPVGMHVLHSCDNPRCVNPAHLSLGTHADNMKDKRAKNRGKSISRPGTKNPAAALNDAQVLAIRADKRPQTAIAAEYGVSQMTISYIKRRLTWAHL